MFDIGFSEILLFGIIALIVLGPEKLPKAARTAGQWYAKARRTITTLQSEIEAEFDLAETRQQMQDEIAKIRQTEAEMKREMAEMRGSMREFEYSQNSSFRTQHQAETAHHADKQKQATPAEFSYAYTSEQTDSDEQSAQASIKASDDDNESASHSDQVSDLTSEANVDYNDNANRPVIQPIITKPWENMWFRLGAYDKARRLPAAPFLPNYRADPLLNAASNIQEAVK